MRVNFNCCITILLLFFFGACAVPRSEWKSTPEIARSTAQAGEIQIKPLKLDKPYFTVFELMVTNKTNLPLEINWNETRFVYGKKDLGIFVFKGLNPEDIKNKTIPNEVVGPAETMVKQILPAHTIAWTPGRLTSQNSESSFSTGVLPNGNNTISLSFMQNGRTWQQTLTIRITETQLPSKQ